MSEDGSSTSEREQQASTGGESRVPEWLPYVSYLAAPVFGLLGFLIYVISRGGYEAFFRGFSVSLEDVGLGEAGIVATAGIGVVYLLLVVTAITAVSIAIESIRVERLSKKVPPFLRKLFQRKDEREDLAATAGSSILVGLTFRFGIRRLLEWVVGREIRLGVGALFLGLTGQPWAWLYLLLPLDFFVLSALELRRRRKNRSLWLLINVVSLVAFLSLVHIDFEAEGRVDALHASEGRPVHSTLLGISTEPVCVQWTDPSLLTAPSLSRDLPTTDTFLLLGSGQMLVLYDLHNKQTVQVPRDQIILVAASLPTSTQTRTKEKGCVIASGIRDTP